MERRETFWNPYLAGIALGLQVVLSSLLMPFLFSWLI